MATPAAQQIQTPNTLEYMKIITFQIAAGLLALLLCSGCATPLTRSKEAWGKDMKGVPYRATLVDVHMIACGWGLIDLPFSLAMDTLLLPVDLVELATKKK